MAFKRILVAIDFSDIMDRILSTAKSVAETNGAEILCCTALEIPPENTLLGGSLKPLIDLEAEREKARKKLEKAVADAGLTGLCSRILVLDYLPGDEIPEAAAREKCDLILLGTHGRSGLKHFVVGSVAERVLRGSPVPVLVVK